MLVSFVRWLFAAAAVASLLASGQGNSRRQDGPVDPGTATDCTYWDTALDSSFTCQYLEETWSISHADFVDWNPGVKSDCSGIKVGNSYCVEVNYGLPRPTSTIKTATSAAPTPTSTGTPKPSPTQEGLVGTCTQFYKAVSGDNCSKLVATFGTFSLSDFLTWNPAVGADCSGLWLGYYYCVAVPGSPTKPTTTKPATTRTTAPPSGPNPTQAGIVSNCQRYHKAVSGDTCQKIVDKYQTFTLSQFLKWNPAVGADCSALWLDYYYCVGIPGTPTKASTPSVPAETCNPSASSPTQPQPVCRCKKWHQVASGNTCASIAKQYSITLANFYKWNPAVGSSCTSLWLGYYVCVATYLNP